METKSTTRYFKIVGTDGQMTGRYSGSTPKQAASKAFTKVLQQNQMITDGNDRDSCIETTKIILRESTRGSNRKMYAYTASRIKLSEPNRMEIRDVHSGKSTYIEYDYQNKVKEIPVPEQYLNMCGSDKKPNQTDRQFNLIDSDGQIIGTYTADTPKQAASKAFTKLAQEKAKIILREVSNGKTYGFMGSRIKLDNPESLKVTDKLTGETHTVTYHYRNDMRKIPDLF